MLNPDGPFSGGITEAKLRYETPKFTVVKPGTHVTCAVTGTRIPVDELRYWSVARQEAYVDALASFECEARAR